MPRSLRRRLPRIGRWPRLCAAGICLLLALTSAMGAKRPGRGSAESVAVVVAARPLPAGHRLARPDLTVARWPAALRPSGARGSPGPLVGQRLAAPVTAREPITSSRILGPGLVSGLGSTSVAASVPLADPHAADFVRAGDRVDVLITPRPVDAGVGALPTGAPKITTAAEHVLVLAVLPSGDGTDSIDASDTRAEVVLAVDRATAVQLTRNEPGELFTLVVDPP